jgi:hypothetical protein
LLCHDQYSIKWLSRLDKGGGVSLYNQDFYQWTQEQAALLRAGALSRLDVENLVEEIESMGKSQKKELVSRLAVLIMHLLKWDYQSERRSKSWLKTIATQRTEIDFILFDNPSMKHDLPETIDRAYKAAVKRAVAETGKKIDVFPEACPYTIDQIMGE